MAYIGPALAEHVEPGTYWVKSDRFPTIESYLAERARQTVRGMWSDTITTGDLAQYIAENNITNEVECKEMYREFVRLFVAGVNAHAAAMGW